MTDEREFDWESLGGPRPISSELRSKVLEQIREFATGEDIEDALTKLDEARPLPASLRARVRREVRATQRGLRRWRSPSILVAGVAAVLVLAMVALDTFRIPPSARRTAQWEAASLRPFDSEKDFVSYMKSVSVSQESRDSVLEDAPAPGARTGEAPVVAQESRQESGLGSDAVRKGSRLPPPVPAEQPSEVTSGEARPPAPGAESAEAPGESTSYSTTNVQEQAVDEPDIVKTDGARLAVLARGTLWIYEMKDATPELRGRLPAFQGSEMFLQGDKLVLLGEAAMAGFPQRGRISGDSVPPQPVDELAVIGSGPKTKVMLVDISSLDDPKELKTFEVDGRMVGARMARGVVRFVIHNQTVGPAPITPTDYSPEGIKRYEEESRERLQDAEAEDFIPKYHLGESKVSQPIHGWQEVARPLEESGASMISVLTLNLDDFRPDNAVSIIGGGDIIYASEDSLYVTTSRQALIADREAFPNIATTIHKFDIRDPNSAKHVASGEISGTLLNQFSMSEHESLLRTASTGFNSEGTSESAVTVLRQVATELQVIGKVEGLGKTERIYAVRFIGPLGYVVTFRQTDPLYVVDLRDPTKPEVKGELKIPGYSGYLHPIDDSLLIGVGQDADREGRVRGVQVSLFDVSNPAAPAQISQKTLAEFGQSIVEQDHRGFLFWKPRDLLVVPISNFDPRTGAPRFGAIAVEVKRESGVGNPTEIFHGDGRSVSPEGFGPAISRSMVFEENLMTFSDAGIKVNRLEGLSELRWIPLPS